MVHPSTLNSQVVFRLIVTDANNQVSTDSVIVVMSEFTYTLDYWEFNIYEGQSIYFEWGAAAYSDYPPFQHYWHPTHGLSDSTSETVWAHPDHSISYYCKVTDAYGCYVDAFRFRVNVIPVGTNDLEFEHAITFPNPADDRVDFKLEQQPDQERELSIYRVDGSIILTQIVNTSEFSIDVSTLLAGEYLYRITGKDNKVYSGIFVKQH